MIEVIGSETEYLLGCEDDIASTLKAKDVLLKAEAEVVEKPVEIKPVHAKLGPAFKEHAKEIIDKLGSINPEELALAIETGELGIAMSSGETVKIEKDMVEIRKVPMLDGEEVQSVSVGNLLILIGE